jgi:hypothetical protein
LVSRQNPPDEIPESGRASNNGCMVSERQKRNLRRGGISGAEATAVGLDRRRPSLQREDERLAQVARMNPGAATLELHADLRVGVRKLTRQWLKAGSDPQERC